MRRPPRLVSGISTLNPARAVSGSSSRRPGGSRPGNCFVSFISAACACGLGGARQKGSWPRCCPCRGHRICCESPGFCDSWIRVQDQELVLRFSWHSRRFSGAWANYRRGVLRKTLAHLRDPNARPTLAKLPSVVTALKSPAWLDLCRDWCSGMQAHSKSELSGARCEVFGSVSGICGVGGWGFVLTLPSERGTRRWGQRSRNVRQVPDGSCIHTTKSIPNRVILQNGIGPMVILSGSSEASSQEHQYREIVDANPKQVISLVGRSLAQVPLWRDRVPLGFPSKFFSVRHLQALPRLESPSPVPGGSSRGGSRQAGGAAAEASR